MTCTTCGKESAFDRCLDCQAAYQRGIERRERIRKTTHPERYQTREQIMLKWPIESTTTVMIQSRKRQAVVIRHGIYNNQELIWCWSEGWGLCPYTPEQLLEAEIADFNGNIW